MRSQADKFLNKYFGFKSFKPGQDLIIDSILSGHNTLGIMPTGAGKSLCYQIPALCFEGITIVISPLISLMKDQVDFLHSINYPAELLNSTVSYENQEEIKESLINKEIKLLYLTPERFKNKKFFEFILTIKVSCFVVDEAHCISEWGHDFRPEYRNLSKIIEKIDHPPVLALTATATQAVKKDIVESLKMGNANVFVTGFNRSNLVYGVQNHFTTKEKNLALHDFIGRVSSPGIIYTSSVKDAESLYNYLKTNSSKVFGLYHGGLDNKLRKQAQENFQNDKIDILIATNAFGMGVNKHNIRFVVHYSIPGSIEAYYQETGRAGRDDKTSYCLLFSMDDDERIQNFFIRTNNPEIDLLIDVLKFIKKQAKKKVLYIDEIIKNLDNKKISSHMIKVIIKQLQYLGCIEIDYISKATIEISIVKNLQDDDVETLEDILSINARNNKFFSYSKEYLLKRANITIKELLKILDGLKIRKAVDYKILEKGHVIKLLKDAIDANSVKNYKEKILKKIELDRKKLKMVVDYSRLDSCRRKFLLNYFGEDYNKENCNMCDICRGTYKRHDILELNILQKDILLFFHDHNSKIGKIKAIKILTGSYDLEPFYRDWDEFAKLRKYKSGDLEENINLLLKANFLEIERNKYSVVRITKQGIKELKIAFNKK